MNLGDESMTVMLMQNYANYMKEMKESKWPNWPLCIAAENGDVFLIADLRYENFIEKLIRFLSSRRSWKCHKSTN